MSLIDDRFLTNNAIDFAAHFPKLANILTRQNTAVVIGQSGINRKGSGCDLTEQDLFNGFTFQSGVTYNIKAGTYTIDTANSKYLDFQSFSALIGIESGVRIIGTDRQNPIKIQVPFQDFPQTLNVSVLGDGSIVNLPSGGILAFLAMNNIVNFDAQPVIVVFSDAVTPKSNFVGEIAAVPNDNTINMRFPYRNWWSNASQLIGNVGISIPKVNVTIKNINTGIQADGLYFADIDIVTPISDVTLDENVLVFYNSKVSIKYTEDWLNKNLILSPLGGSAASSIIANNSILDITAINYNATPGTWHIPIFGISSQITVNKINSNVPIVFSLLHGCDLRFFWQHGAAKNYNAASQGLSINGAKYSKIVLNGGLGVGNLLIVAHECWIDTFWNSGGTVGTISISNTGADAVTNTVSITETF